MSDGLEFRIEAPETPAVVAPDGVEPGDVDPFDAPEFALESAEVTEDEVRGLLELLGNVGNVAADEDVPDQWLFTETELAVLVPALTRIVNRHEWMRRFIARGDGLVVIAGLVMYGHRNVQAGAEARHQREENDPHGHVHDEARGVPLPGPRADGQADSPWGHGVGPAEAAGLGQFQG